LAEALEVPVSDGRLAFTRRTAARLLSAARNVREVRRLRERGDLEGVIAFATQPPLPTTAYAVSAYQRPSEIRSFLAMASSLRPRAVVEIGTAAGGTLFMLACIASRDARIVSVDLPGGAFGGGYSWWRKPLYRSFARDRQRVVLLRGDSHAPATVARVRTGLDGRPIDLLFIDGDHTFAGVRADFDAYAAWVRPGGLIAFHDIKDDPGQPQLEVGRFWREVATRFASREFVESPGQSGYGIGVLTMPDGWGPRSPTAW
jgi:cephalosporin hydroxylase